jgi:hypothetical protein
MKTNRMIEKDRIENGCILVYLMANEPYLTIEESTKSICDSENNLFTKSERTRIKKKLKTYKFYGWIPVTFEKPKVRDVIVSDELDGVKGSIYYDGVFYKSGIISNGTFDNVTHWGHFPDKPKKIQLKLDCKICSHYFQNPFDQGYCELEYDINKTCKGKKFELL